MLELTPQERALWLEQKTIDIGKTEIMFAKELVDTISDAIEDEREACAKLCESNDHNVVSAAPTPAWDLSRFTCAAAIRLRSKS